jgi:preprotein translocase subunit SecE
VAEKRKKRSVRRQPSGIRRFFRETIGELRKVSWPTRQEAINLTIMVLGVTIAMSVFLGLLDVAFSRFFALLLGA